MTLLPRIEKRWMGIGATIAAALSLILTACSGAATPPTTQPTATARPTLSGQIKADGSSTVFPISEAVAEEFQKNNKGVQVTVGISGTGGGFKKFCAGETDISNASRPITEAEMAECAKNNIQYIELPVAYDGLSVLANPKNTFVSCMTAAELKKIWEPAAQGKVTMWNQVRAEWPAQPLKLYGAGTDSGTFDYFTQVINGKEKDSRGDFTPSEDDNVLVQGISGDVNSLGYFGYAYYVENKDKLKLVSIDAKADGNCIAPNDKSITDFSYLLARPIFIYIKTTSAEKPEVREFVKFYLENGTTLVKEVGYIPIDAKFYSIGLTRFQNNVKGTMYTKDVLPKTPLDQIYK